MTLEVSFVGTKSVGGKGGFNLKVVTAEASGKYDRQETQVRLRYSVEQDATRTQIGSYGSGQLPAGDA